ncbi:myocyte-specific enhancer factor 2A-like [Lampris incognitus]|uniref:myocyte-specific enhancer factor 2A-like n=1 Tax=Lampris incognitus TaxID=2546036 RepID=UPI0024B5773D|nr:myocyte-specific enhancer factor 2A-like [Lampris incognitus]
MGRKKIQITRILDERNRQVTFTKRKFGLMKKAYELSVLCDCEIALIIFNSSNKLFQYASTDMDKVLLKYTEYNEPHESRTNSDIVEALNKKEHRGGDSPDPDATYVLTPHTEEKYKKINEEFDNMMRNHKLSTGVPQQNFMNVAPPGVNPNSFTYSHGVGGGTSQALAAATAALAESGILSSPHVHLHRSMASPHRPPSTGNTGGLQGNVELVLPNGSSSGPGPMGNGFAAMSGDGSLGKVIPTKSPPPPSQSSLTPGSRKTDLRVLIPPSSKGMMQTQNTHRLGRSLSTQPLTTPVVSAATPSLPHQPLVYSGINSAYSNDYSLNSPDLSALHSFTSPASLPPGSTWQHHQLGAAAGGSLVSGSANAATANHNLHIKAEPISPPRDRLSQSGYMTQAPTPTLPLNSSSSSSSSCSARPETGRSPADSISSSCSSYEGSDREEQRRDFHSPPLGGIARPQTEAEGRDSPTVKRLCMDGWVT